MVSRWRTMSEGEWKKSDVEKGALTQAVNLTENPQIKKGGKSVRGSRSSTGQDDRNTIG